MTQPNNFSSEYVRERDKVVAEHNAEVHLGKRPLCSCFRQGCDWATERASEIPLAEQLFKVQQQLTEANALIEEMAEALRQMKGAMWCENIDEQNKAYESATEALAKYKEWKK